MPQDDLLVIVDVGLRVGPPLGDAATTLPFQREEHDTERVMRVAPISDETVPYAPADLERLAIQPPPEPMIPISLAAGIDLVAIDRTPARRPEARRAGLGTALIVAGLLVAALAAGIALAFGIAAIA